MVGDLYKYSSSGRKANRRRKATKQKRQAGGHISMGRRKSGEQGVGGIMVPAGLASLRQKPVGVDKKDDHAREGRPLLGVAQPSEVAADVDSTDPPASGQNDCEKQVGTHK